MCRRHGGTGLQTFARFARGAIDFEGVEPSAYRSSTWAQRSFCPHCGSSLLFEYDDEPDHLWVMAGSLDQPEQISPTCHFMAEDRVYWVQGSAKEDSNGPRLGGVRGISVR
jgi:hypothetical protein